MEPFVHLFLNRQRPMIIYLCLFFAGVLCGYALAILATSLKASEYEQFKILALRELMQSMHCIDSLANQSADISLKEALAEAKKMLNEACIKIDRY